MSESKTRRNSVTRTRSPHPPSKGPGTPPDDLASADINLIMAQYAKNGTLPRVNPQTPLYGDFTQSTDLMDAMDRVNEALDRFEQLPASVRSVADGNPVRFLEMFDSDEERVLLTEAGLILDENEPSEPSTPSQPSSEAVSEAGTDQSGDTPPHSTDSK